jgi:hypothetical protein
VVKYFPAFPVCDGSASTAPQDEAVPLVVKYLPEFPVWSGTTYTLDVSSDTVTAPEVPPPDNPVPAVTPVMSPGFGAAHSSPVALALLTLRTYPLVAATVNALNVLVPVPASN